MTMATQKRAHEEVDPDYPDACAQLIKKQREAEQDAKQAVTRRVQNIVRNEFQKEIKNKEVELQQIDRRLNEARLMMDRLRACVVANYYGRVNLESASQASSVYAPPPSIHPVVKKYLGKKPANYHQNTYSDFTGFKTLPDKKLYVQNRVLECLSVLKKDGSSTELQSTTSMIANQDNRSHDLINSAKTSSSATVRPVTSVAGDAAYDDRRARTKLKKKIVIGNVSKYIPIDHREPNDMSSHKWMVYVRGPKSDPDISTFVKKVWFFLHHSFKPNDLVEISSPPFHLTRRGWGEFPVRVQLHFVDPRNKKVDIIHHLKLDKTFTGLQSLGAETSIEVELERDAFESADNRHVPSLSSTLSQASNTFSQSTQASSEKEVSLSTNASAKSAIHTVSTENIFIKSEPSESCYETESKSETEIDSAAQIHKNMTEFGDFHMTIAHDTDDCEENVKIDTEEEMVVDICEENNKSQRWKMPQLSSEHLPSEKMVHTNLTNLTLLTLTKDGTSDAVQVGSMQSSDTSGNTLPVRYQTTAADVPSTNTPHFTTCTQQVRYDSVTNSCTNHMKPSSAVQNVMVSPVSSSQHSVVHTESVASSQLITPATVTSLFHTAGVRHTVATSSTSRSIAIAQPLTIKASLSMPTFSACTSSQISCPRSSTTSMHSSLSVSKTTSQDLTTATPVVLSQSTQLGQQMSISTPSMQKVIILQPSLVSKTKSVSENKNSITSKSSGPRQVSLLTGRVVTPQSMPSISSQTEIPRTNNIKVCASSVLPKATYSEQQVITQVTDRPVSGLVQNTSKPASVFLISKQSFSSSLSPSSMTMSSLANPKITLVPAVSQSSGNSCSTRNGQAAETGMSSTSNMSVANANTLVTRQLKHQASLLTSAQTSSNSSPVPAQKNQYAIMRPIIVDFSGYTQVSQGPKLDSKPHLNMSALGKTKHGCASPQLLGSDKLIPTTEERKKNQYEILKTWKENPQLYQRSTLKNKKIVLAVKDMIEGEPDAIPDLNSSDYPTMKSLLKAAVRLHPLVQTGVNKLTHPYCAESIDQWNSWTIGKQRASEWHRACFVLKYIKSSLGNQTEFKGEKLMSTRQLVKWCRNHAFSPVVTVRKTKVMPETQECEPGWSRSVWPDNNYVPSYTHMPELDFHLSPEIIASLKNNTDGEDMDLDIMKISRQKTDKQYVKPDPYGIESSVEWLSPSDGACFVHEQLRKRGIKTQPVTMVPGIVADTVAEMIFRAMLEFGSDVLTESLGSCAESSETTQITRLDVHKALTGIPEATFCCNKFLGKNACEGDCSGR